MFKISLYFILYLIIIAFALAIFTKTLDISKLRIVKYIKNKFSSNKVKGNKDMNFGPASVRVTPNDLSKSDIERYLKLLDAKREHISQLEQLLGIEVPNITKQTLDEYAECVKNGHLSINARKNLDLFIKQQIIDNIG